MKNKILSIALAAVISAGIFSAPVQEFTGGISAVAEAAATVSAPTASKKSGTYSTSGAFSVKLTSATDGASIYYSTGGSYKLYTKALKISKNTTIKCYAKKDGVKSKTVTLTYKLTPKVTVSAAAGTYSEPVTVKLSSTASGVKFYYTLDGSKPTTKSTLYTTKGITISESAKLRFVAVKSGWSSKYFTRDYVIESKKAALPSESILEDYTSKYAYNTLNSTEKKVYAAIYKAVGNHDEYAYITEYGANDDEVANAYWAFDFENPQFFWLSNGYSYSSTAGVVTRVQIKYSRSKEGAEMIQPQFDAAAQKIIDKALEQDDLFDRVLVLHDSIIDMTDYKSKGNSYISEADGPLLNGVALCEGYSKAFMYLCQSIGIECICVAGYAGENHMWNMLKLDGEWYNMDVTWDDPVGGSKSYQYFCLPTSKIKSDHSFNNFFPVPSATATKYGYSEVMGINEYTTLNSAYNGLLNDAAANYKNGIMETTVFISGDFMNSFAKKVNDMAFYNDLTAKGCKFTNWSTRYSTKSLVLTIS